MILNKASVERGLAHASVYKCEVRKWMIQYRVTCSCDILVTL